ncbi:hypothetical protein BLNAU_1642 [Blattamonas nauphoetae]|uniref:Uncharacterized protein n=1 Tax=Blattamonas nauphoetae TaxID=2049346 RepID=A0ABQ9YIL1_9EUKA|nr:hypothetical protein BLNAU_1642 [Blattamonas nauphoetae]
MTGKSGKGTMNCKWTSYFCAMLGQQRHPLPPPPKPRVIVSSIFIPQPDPHFIFTTMDEEKKDLSKMTDMEHCSIDSAIKDDIDLLTPLLRRNRAAAADVDHHCAGRRASRFCGEPEHDVFTLSSMVASVSQDSTVCVFDLTTFTVLFIIPPRYPLRPSVHFSIISLEWNALAHPPADISSQLFIDVPTLLPQTSSSHRPVLVDETLPPFDDAFFFGGVGDCARRQPELGESDFAEK